jgi:hypothetical protein
MERVCDYLVVCGLGDDCQPFMRRSRSESVEDSQRPITLVRFVGEKDERPEDVVVLDTSVNRGFFADKVYIGVSRSPDYGIPVTAVVVLSDPQKVRPAF